MIDSAKGKDVNRARSGSISFGTTKLGAARSGKAMFGIRGRSGRV